MTPYSTFIAKSRYSRYLNDKNRREHWNETVSRYFTFMFEHLEDKYKYKPTEALRTELTNAVQNLEVMPSMRAIMTAGKALDRDNTAGYNCSYLPIDDPKAFDEAMYILLCGTGVGFSVEHKYVDQLPEVPDQLFDSQTTISVADSKEGWAKALRQLMALLYSGEVAKYDLSRIRPAGARLKTFGGRASGPGPLDELFKFTIAKFRGAVGRKLTSIECHDLLCKIGEVVVVGGVRRSAMISLSDLEDDRMRSCKSGNWWEQNGHRALANNSATYNSKPDIGQFLQEWTSLYNSHSGERGIFSREASQSQAAKNGRRDSSFDFGTNPCSEIILRPYQFCNLTEVVVRAEDTVESLANKIRIATILGTFQSTMTNFPYLRKVWQKNTEEERLLGVSLTGILDNKWMGEVSDSTAKALEQLRKVAVDTNADLATRLGIPQSAAITCVKPSGTVSQLVDSASGIHARHSQYYIRRVRGDKKDPLSAFLTSAGVPAEDCVMRPDSTVVFSFPMKAPEGARLRDDLTAIEHLDVWMMYQRHWCEHKPSVTISVKEDEWMDVGAWVFRNFDEISGVSFLPWAGGTYRQAPYEECTKEQYEEMLSKMPKEIKWDDLVEVDDNVEGAQTLACVAGHCEI
ncbi:RTPR, ribonucleoside-triphosphate reductase, adenosylcobalamin-dependent [uncultured Caudovirales phage]|uniref:RTPR, ribonucleoside-triphosphate reductase, adenosylcobalamin-dependent n=1 Tax=uncultured Caudovirales phage TaxID=2100421 RepID=A0A6J5P9V4_9CAUD|nr:RTPR, ribonucleoside-triphosphate reductase, adenosylcobalamin-dependent [uncultured Caudovirales phage]